MATLNQCPLSSQLLSSDIDQALEEELADLGIDASPHSNPQDYQEIKYIFTSILQYPLTRLGKYHREANRIGVYDLRAAPDSEQAYQYFERREVRKR